MQKKSPSPFEFIALMASLMSIVALAIDALLPALDYIGLSIGITQAVDNQLLIGFLFGNLRALAMEPIGHIAGIGAAITGFLSTMMAVPISTYIGKFVTANALPLFIGFLICSTMALLILAYLKVSNPQIIKNISFKSV